MIENSVEAGKEQSIDILVDYDHLPTASDVDYFEQKGFEVTYVSHYINTIAVSGMELSLLPELIKQPGIVMIEKQSEYIPLLDTSVPAMKARESSVYSSTSVDFGVTGDGVVIAVIDTGVDNEHDGLEGQKRFLEDEFDLIVLSVLLPEINGLDLLRNIRKTSNIPIIIITEKSSEVDRVIGLELGADDYLVKPFFMREFVARINAILRRYRRETHSLNAGTKLTEFESLRLDAQSRTAYLEDSPLSITSVEYDLLESLMHRAGIIVSRETLSQKVLRRAFSPLDRSIDVHISQLRKKIGPRPDGSLRIKTVRGSGYIFVID